MSERLGPYQVIQLERREGFLSIWRAQGKGKEGRLYWFEVKGPEARAAFFRFRKALRALAPLGVLPAGIEISAKPGLYYVFWPKVNSPSALPPKGRKVVNEVGRVLAALAPLGYALPDLDLRLGENGVVVAGLEPLAEHDEIEATRLGGRFLKGIAASKTRPSSKRGSRNWLPGLLLALLGAFLLVAGANRYLNPPVFTLPDLRGLSAKEALEKVDSMGLKVVFNETSDPEKPIDVIVEQNPEPGAHIKPQHRLELFINHPKEGFIPKLTGLPLDEAQRVLSVNGFQPAEIKSSYSNVPAGIVISSAPPAGVPLPQGAQIKLLVSAGPNPKTTLLPDLTGLSLEEARYLLSTAELQIGDVQEVPSPEPNGTVLAQSPPAGSEIAVGSPVTLTVASKAEVLIPRNPPGAPVAHPQLERPPETENQTRNPTPVKNEELSPGEKIVPIRVSIPQQSNRATVHVRLVVQDESGSKTPIDTYAPVGTTLEGSVRIKGKARFQLYLDGFLYQQWDSEAQ